MTILLLLCLSTHPLLASNIWASLWQEIGTRECLPESLMERQIGEGVVSSIECLTLANGSGLTVVQFSLDSHRCQMFSYRHVCHLVDEAKSPASSLSHKCSVFATASALAFLRLSRRLLAAVGPGLLRGAWVMGPDEEASRTNLVCGETQLWQSEAVQWTAEGARFDGSSTTMTLENVNVAFQPGELSLLVRVKPEISAVNMPMLTGFKCRTELTTDFSLWDSEIGSRVPYFYRATVPQTVTRRTNSDAAILNPNVWAEFGIVSSARETVNFFSNGNFVTSVVHDNFLKTELPDNQFRCLGLGIVPGDTRRLKGLVQAAGIANASLSLEQINRFYEAVRHP